MNPRTKNLLIAFALVTLVMTFGTVEDWFGDTIYGADGIAYIDNATAIRHGDWATALNPYWSIGYPLVLAATRWMFPEGWAGEWLAVHVVNLVIFAATYAGFLYFLQTALAYAARRGGTRQPLAESPGLFAVGSLIFLEWQIQTKQVSQMTPDLLISGLFFVLIALSLQFCQRPATQSAGLMGLTAGLGYIAKAAFLPISAIVFFCVLLRIFTQSHAERYSSVTKLAWFAPAAAMLALPYILALSLTLGKFTLGESGSLNYAWTVNKLTHWHWTGGPAAFGEPLHPVRLLSTSPHVYEYAEPIHVTYPPFYNPYYWYEGYHHFFAIRNQVAAIRSNLFNLSTLFFSTPRAPTKFWSTIALLIVAAIAFTDRAELGKRLRALWPLYLPPLLGIAMYTSVFLEARYVTGFLIVLIVTLLLALFVPTPVIGKRAGALILVVISLISLTYLFIDARHTLGRAWRDAPYFNDEEWRIGFYLTGSGIAPGTRVAMVKEEHGIQTTWAFVAGLRVVGQIGNQDFKEEQQAQDLQLFLNRPELQQTVFELFRKSAAEIVVALNLPQPPKGDGWTQVPETKAWLHRL
jgi:hypothetical protein